MTRNPTIGSVFSGIGGFDLGFTRAGFDVAWMCEREAFCRKVLAGRFVGVPCFDDVTTLTEAPAVDVLVGGFPCQDVSIAGPRKGLGGERSGLFFEFVRLLRLLKPRNCVIENVDGLLSNDLGADFATVIAHLADVGYVGAWRVLDSQWFGVAQRRERVFFVGCLGGQLSRAAAVLFESARSAWDLAPRQQAGTRPAATLRGRSHNAGVNELGRGGEDDQNLVVGGGSWPTFSKEHPTLTGRRADQTAVAFTLPSVHRGVGNGHNTNYLPVVGALGAKGDGWRLGPDEVAAGQCVVASSGERARALTASMHKRHDEDTDTLIASPITASAGHHGHSSPRGDGRDNLVASFAENQRGELLMNDTAGALKVGGGKPGQGYPAAMQNGGVRRLTPLECERLQGFPDGWTCLCGDGHRGSAFCTCPDTPRYKALGNAVTVNVAEWIAHRMMESGRLTP